MQHPGWIGPNEDSFNKNRRWECLKENEKRIFKESGVRWGINEDAGVRGALRKNAGCYYYPKLIKNKLWRG